MRLTCSLSARPLPEMAALTSLGVCQTTGRSAWAAASAATPAACAVPVAVPLLFWVKTRSIATTSGRCSRSSAVTAVCSSSSRSSRSSSAAVRTTPTPTAVGRAPGRPSTTPHPHRVRPGSMPSTRMEAPPDVSRTGVRPTLTRPTAGDTPRHPRPLRAPPPARPGHHPELAKGGDGPFHGGAGVLDPLEHLVGDVVVGEDVLHVVAVLERVDEPEDLARGLLVELDRDAGHEAGVGGVVVDAGVLQRGAHRDQVGRLAHDLEAVALVAHLLGPGVQHGHEHGVLVDGVRLRHHDDALAREEVGDRAGVG